MVFAKHISNNLKCTKVNSKFSNFMAGVPPPPSLFQCTPTQTSEIGQTAMNILFTSSTLIGYPGVWMNWKNQSFTLRCASKLVKLNRWKIYTSPLLCSPPFFPISLTLTDTFYFVVVVSSAAFSILHFFKVLTIRASCHWLWEHIECSNFFLVCA